MPAAQRAAVARLRRVTNIPSLRLNEGFTIAAIFTIRQPLFYSPVSFCITNIEYFAVSTVKSAL